MMASNRLHKQKRQGFQLSLRSVFQRFAKPSLRGYDHPSLKDAFNKMAQSPFGQNAVDYCKKRSYPLIVTDDMDEGTQGTCSYEQIQVRPNSNYGTLAHEMRHAFQMHTLKTHRGDSGNPIFNHMHVRMTEADAFTFSSLVKLSRWKECGYTADTDLTAMEDGVLLIEKMAFTAYAAQQFRPSVLPQILKHIFRYYYTMIADADPDHSAYEKTGLKAANESYQKLDGLLNPPYDKSEHAGFSNRLSRALYEWAWKGEIEYRLAQYNNTAALIDDFAQTLGTIPGLEKNYLTETKGPKLSDPAYLGLLGKKAAALHQEWHRKIADGMARRNSQPS